MLPGALRDEAPFLPMLSSGRLRHTQRRGDLSTEHQKSSGRKWNRNKREDDLGHHLVSARVDLRQRV